MGFDWEEIKAKYAVQDGRKASPGTNGQTRVAAPSSLAEDAEPYIRTGVANQLHSLATMTEGGRNHALFISAKALGRLEAVDRDALRDQLIEACKTNGLWDDPDDGPVPCRRTIESGYRAADLAGPRIVPGLDYFDKIELVDASVLSGVATLPPPPPPPPPQSAASAAAAPQPQSPGGIYDAEGDFWARDRLDWIYREALGRQLAPWAVLAHCAARILTLVPAHVTLPGLIGSKGSLNWLASVAAPSGHGKTASAQIARDLVPGTVVERNIGSGEGVVGQYKPDSKTGKMLHDAILFRSEELAASAALKMRQGSTISSVLNDAFAGDTLGYSYVKNGPDGQLTAHSYRLVFMQSVQPELAGPIFADRFSGSLQRLQWFPAADPRRIRANRRSGLIPSLPLPDLSALPHGPVIVPTEVEDEVYDHNDRMALGQIGPLDTHSMFIRLKFAFALALLDERLAMSVEDWRLAGIAMAISDRTRDWVRGEADKAAIEEARLKARPAAAARMAMKDAEVDLTEELLTKVGTWVLGYLTKVAPQAPTAEALSRKARAEQRKHVPAALRWLHSDGQVVQVKAKNGHGKAIIGWTIP